MTFDNSPNLIYRKVILYFLEIEGFCQSHNQCNHCPSAPAFLCQEDMRQVISFSGQSRLSCCLLMMGVHIRVIPSSVAVETLSCMKSACVDLSVSIYFY